MAAVSPEQPEPRMTVSCVGMAVVLSDIVIDLIVNGWVGFGGEGSVGVAVGAVSAAGVAAISALEVVCGGKDEVWAFEVEVLGREFSGTGSGFGFDRSCVWR